MATSHPPSDQNPPSSSPLVEALARVLPKGIKFQAHHLSTPPELCDPLYYPPAYPHDGNEEIRARKPLKTYCEKHFLAISIDTPDSKDGVLALALEIFIYTTSHSTIIFVSKADSTGYLSLLKLPRGTPSPIREISTTFVAFLVAHRRRKGVQCIVNLFARAQSQYLFPGSVKNSGKHVLDDRGLVKWWCRVLNPLLEDGAKSKDKKTWDKIHGYLVIPGLDNYDTRAFQPRTTAAAVNWTLGHPLEHISPYIANPTIYGDKIPIRCLIPTYPDDPKARFVIDLEESTPEKAKLASGWREAKTLDQFWEMMAFRQECSAGRLTGFVWLVFDPCVPKSSTSSRSTTVHIPTPQASFSGEPSSGAAADSTLRLSTPEPSQGGLTPLSTPAKSVQSTPAKPRSRRKKFKRVLKGPIIPRQPRIKTHQRARLPELTETAHYSWPEEGRGQVIVDDGGYKRCVELLLHLEFDTLAQAVTSTKRWVKEVNFGHEWGLEIVGRREPEAQVAAASNGTVNDLSGMIKRKRPADEPPTVNTLGVGLVRKKPKIDADGQTSTSAQQDAPKINVLGASFVRKKSKGT